MWNMKVHFEDIWKDWFSEENIPCSCSIVGHCLSEKFLVEWALKMCSLDMAWKHLVQFPYDWNIDISLYSNMWGFFNLLGRLVFDVELCTGSRSLSTFQVVDSKKTWPIVNPDASNLCKCRFVPCQSTSLTQTPTETDCFNYLTYSIT